MAKNDKRMTSIAVSFKVRKYLKRLKDNNHTDSINKALIKHFKIK